MGLMNSALHIGRNALLTYQDALAVVGGNISSAGSADYTRLTPQLAPLQGISAGDGLQPGAGVILSGIRRNIDDALENRVRLASGEVKRVEAEQQALSHVETLFDDINGVGVATRLNDFFNAFGDLQANPEDVATRDLVVAAGNGLAGSLSSMRQSLMQLGADIDSQIPGLVTEADDLARRIADLNHRITAAEAAKRGQATGLRDQREALLRQLGELMDVTVREEPEGSINVYVGSETLIQGARVRGLTTRESFGNGVVRTSAIFDDSGAAVQTRGGRLAGLARARDTHAYGRVASIDELAAAIIADVNAVHADGQGIAGFKRLVGQTPLLRADAPIVSDPAAVAVSPTGGSFYVSVADDETNTVTAFRIDVRFGGAADTSLESLAASINDVVEGVTASITPDNRLELVADDGLSFTFGHDGQEARSDTSGVLAALGLNTFFTGTSAADVAVSPSVTADPNLIAAARVYAIGDGDNAARIAELDTLVSAHVPGRSLVDGFTSIAADVAVTAGAANTAVDASSSVFSALNAQRISISGVSLDEEAIEMLKFERAFQGASRFVGKVDELLQEVMSLVI
ncbi:MAG: flagellar hook-associated protein FlgK [Phycisphaerales bacterium]|nr:MAG: flagellar hook-associated protein FlgK [Phycisphaerales bacterium]